MRSGHTGIVRRAMRWETVHIDTPAGPLRAVVLRPREQTRPLPGILWIHGGGYALGMADMVHASCGKMLAKRFGAVVVSPEYRLATEEPYPAALEDCYATLLFMDLFADELGIRRDKLIVGGEGAGGGLVVASCLLARDTGDVDIALQIPLYPMLDCDDTPSSRDNHGKVWNTARNHWGWRRYLGGLYGSADVPKYASPARERNFEGLPPCYTYVLDGEPFLDETLAYVDNLLAAGVEAQVDVYHGDVHAFDMLMPWLPESRAARQKLCEVYGRSIDR